ncbi:uncharacterized protein LOC117935179 [Etheostoma cragini]|uniref:uncharacterized protein LOC117935179 n=1 Tax=Etheostoma cragini TaxID=417921 RepID=UPI00155DEDE8|nr:uncharacterized protein LOC117935179 [Etheostoma cragini]
MERYESLGLVGEGSYGTVLKCRHRDSGRLVAIKKFVDSDSDRTVKKIALREIQLLRQLRHDNLVNLLEVWKRRRRWYLVFEFVDRTLLEDLEQNPSGLDLNASRRYLFQILRAAAFCHQQQMDPERRAQCSELLEHPLFTQDSFHIRFLDELNAKIQKDHRDNSTLPKISKTPRRERNEGDDKNHRSKDKKPVVNDKVNKERETKEDEKMGKSKRKQQSKLSKTVPFTPERLMSKQSKTFSDNAAKTTLAMKSKPGKATVVDLRKERETPKSTKTRNLDFLETTTTATHLKDNNTVVPKPQQETREDHLKTTDTRDGESTGLNSSCSDGIVPNVTEKSLREIWRSSKSEPSQEFGKTNSNTKVPNLSKRSTTDHPNGTSSSKGTLNSTLDRTDTRLTQKMGKSSTIEYPEGSLTVAASKIANCDQVETSLTLKAPQQSSNDHIEVATPTTPSVTKPCETLRTLEHQGNRSMDTEQKKTSECPKDLTSSPKPAKNNTSLFTSPLKSLSRQSSAISIEAGHVISTTTPPKGSLNLKFKTSLSSDPEPKNDTTCPSRGFATDRKPTEVSIASKNQQDINEGHGCLKISSAANRIDVSDASGGEYTENPESTELCGIHQRSTSESKISTESRITPTSMPNEIPKTSTSVGTNFQKTQKASDKENREDLALSVCVSATTKSLVSQISEVPRSSSFEQKNSSESDVKSLKPPHFKTLIVEPKTRLGSFGNKSTATMTLRTKKTTFPTEARRRRDNADMYDSTNTSTIADATSSAHTATPDHQALTRSLVFFPSMDAADADESDFSAAHSSPPPPPPPSSTPVIPSYSVVCPAASNRLSGFHPGTHSVRCVDKPRPHGGIYSRPSNHITGSLPAQVTQCNLVCERSFLCDRCNHGNSGGTPETRKKSDPHFPDLRSSVLPELRGREGKHNKGASKDQRTDKPSPPSPSDTERPRQASLQVLP